MSLIQVWKVFDREGLIEAVRIEPPPVSLNAVSRALPDGVYTTLRTFDHRHILPLADHVQRLQESARLLNRPISLDLDLLHKALGEAVRRFPGGEARVRISVDLAKRPGDTYLALEPLKTPSVEEYVRGVRAVTVPLRRENPRSKQVRFIETAEAVQRALPPGVNEALMIDDSGFILEGLSSNFFAVRGDTIWTAGEGVLPGITRALVLRAIQETGLILRLDCVKVRDLPILQEAFLTSSSRSVLPLRQINEIIIGSGAPGPVTRRIMDAYEREVRKELEDLIASIE